MSKLNKQDVFNRVYNYYAEGGIPGYDSDMGQCAYFTRDGGRCAMGVVLDSLGYKRGDLSELSLEGDVSDVIKDLGDNLTDNFEPDVYVQDRDGVSDKTFLARMQATHDSTAEDNFMGENGWHEDTRDDLVIAFKSFADDEGLHVPGE